MDSHLSARDPQLVLNIVNHLKSQGIFDQFRRECLADVDTKPSFQNLRQRVEGYVSKFLTQQTWKPDLNKNQLRDALRKHINDSGMLSIGVEHLVDQVVNPKISRTFLPQVESVVRQYLGLERPAEPAACSERKDEPKEAVLYADPIPLDGTQRIVAKIESQLVEKTTEINIVPEVFRKETEKEGFLPVGTGEINLNTPTKETRSSEALVSTEPSADATVKVNNNDLAVNKQEDSTPESKKQILDAQQSTEDNNKISFSTQSIALPAEAERKVSDKDNQIENKNQDDIQKDSSSSTKENMLLTEMLYDDNSVSCADSNDGDSKLVINEDSVMSEINMEIEDTDSQNKNNCNKESNSQNSCSASGELEKVKSEPEEIKFDLKSIREVSSNPETSLEVKQKELKNKTPVKKEVCDVKEEKPTKEAHKKHEKEKSPSKHKLAKHGETSKARQSNDKNDTKHRSNSSDKHKSTDKMHKHSGSSKSSKPDSKTSKSHSEHKSKSSVSKPEQKHKSSHSASSRSHDKLTKSSEPSPSSSKPSSSSKTDKNDSEKKPKSSKDGSADQRHKSSSTDSKVDKVKIGSRDGSKSSKLSEDKSKTQSKYGDSKSSSSSEKHKSSESSRAHDKYKSKESSKHSSSSRPLEKMRHRESSSRSDNKHDKKRESSSKDHSKSSKHDEKKTHSKKSNDASLQSSQDVPEKSSSSDNSNTCDSIIKEFNKNKDPVEGKDETDTKSQSGITQEAVSEMEPVCENSNSEQSSDLKESSCESSVKDVTPEESLSEKTENSKTDIACGKNEDMESSEKKISCLGSVTEVKEDITVSVDVTAESKENTTSDCTNPEQQCSPEIKVVTDEFEKEKANEVKNEVQSDCKDSENCELKDKSGSTIDNDDATALPSEISSETSSKIKNESKSKQDPEVVDSESDEEKADLMKSLVLQKSEDESGSIFEGQPSLAERNVKGEDEEKKSDITVSSVHTSDLSSYDDKISLSSSDELQAVESVNPTVKEKKVALKEIKEVAATYLKSRTNSSGRSTPVFPSGDDDTNQSSSKQRTDKSKTEAESSSKTQEESQHSDDEDGVRGSSRFGRQRKANPKYASEEYIFNSSWKELDHSPAAVAPTRRTTRKSAEDNQKSSAKSSSGSSAVDSPQNKPDSSKTPRRKRRWSKASDKSSKEQTDENSGRTSADLRSTEKSAESPSKGDSQAASQEVLTRSKRKREPSKSPERGKNRAENKRYRSSDLYKPRPVIGPRHHRTVEEASNNEQSQDESSQEHQKRPRGRPRKRPSTPEPQPPPAKRKR